MDDVEHLLKAVLDLLRVNSIELMTHPVAVVAQKCVAIRVFQHQEGGVLLFVIGDDISLENVNRVSR